MLVKHKNKDNKFEIIQKKLYLCLKPKKMKAKDKNLNRIKVMLAEKDKKNFWLAKKLGVNQATVSQWCTNNRQPSLYTLANIAKILDVDVRQLINSTK